MASNNHQIKFFNFLQQKESKNECFSTQEILNATGWAKSTFNSYLVKGQISEFVSSVSKDVFEASNSLNITFKQFEKKLSQSKHIQALGHNCKSKLSKALIRKSKDNMVLALELYNRPSLENKIDAFVMLFCTAWEQLLKAILIERDGEESIYNSKNKNGIKETISLRECLKRARFENDKIKENILRITDMRDSAVHLLIPEMQPLVSRIFQSGVFNYASQFEAFCEVPFINTTNTGMISLVGDFNLPPLSLLSSLYGKAAEQMLEYIESLKSLVEEENDASFAIPLYVSMMFAKKDSEGTQITLTKAEDGISALKEALVIQKGVDIEKTHPHRQSDAIKEINKRLNEKYDKKRLVTILVASRHGKPEFNRRCFQAVINKLKWKNSENQYHHYSSLTKTHSYSNRAISEIINKITSDPEFLKKARSDLTKKN